MPGATDLYFPVSDARAEAKYIHRVELVPIPSVWGHVAGGGGDEGAKPFINARVGAFLRQPAAEPWLTTALGPHASTAAISRASGASALCPTAYTPRWSGCSRTR